MKKAQIPDGEPALFVDNRSGEPFPPALEAWVKNVVTQSLILEQFHTYDTEISLSIVNNMEIRELNRLYRGKDKATDVLSFPLYEEGVLMPPGMKLPLGDIVISIEKAREQAAEYGHSLEREVGFLTAHSMLHLLGYDHGSEDDERVMRDKQGQILEKIGLSRG